MKDFLIIPEDGYDISDGEMGREYLKATEEQINLLKLIEEDLKQKASLHCKEEWGYNSSNFKLRWYGVWNNEIELGYERFDIDIKEQMSGRICFNNASDAQKLSDRLSIFISLPY